MGLGEDIEGGQAMTLDEAIASVRKYAQLLVPELVYMVILADGDDARVESNAEDPRQLLEDVLESAEFIKKGDS